MGVFVKELSFRAQSQPKCHLPIDAVWYALDFKKEATVNMLLGIKAWEVPLRTPLLRRLRQLYLPVNIPYRIGVHTEEQLCVSVNIIP
tara:strand:- start:248 stop:511 length:264 start_codon:yes stop_codon:yes gene_type:complete